MAIGETISMMLFRAGRRRATEPLTRAALEAASTARGRGAIATAAIGVR